MTDFLPSYCSLQNELNQAKNTLVSLNDNIRRVIGRDPKEVSRRISQNESKRTDFEKLLQKDNKNLPNKKRNSETKSVFNRLSTPLTRKLDYELKPRLHSRVIRELPTRQEIVKAQCSDAESRARNRRMFGSLLGTLHKFCLEESRLKDKEDKKAKIEKKLEQQEQKEKETMKKKRELLFLDRKRKQLEIRKLEIKMSRLKDFEHWNSAQKYMKCNIKTKTKPHIYFRPSILNKKTEKLLSDSRNSIKKEIIKKQDLFNKEIAVIDSRYKWQENYIEECKSGISSASNKDQCNYVGVSCESEMNEEILKCFYVADPPLNIKLNKFDYKENSALNINDPTLPSIIHINTSQ